MIQNQASNSVSLSKLGTLGTKNEQNRDFLGIGNKASATLDGSNSFEQLGTDLFVFSSKKCGYIVRAVFEGVRR